MAWTLGLGGGGGADLVSFYTQHAAWLDGLLYLILFTGIAQVSLGSRFSGRGGRGIVVATGISLAIAASVSARGAGWTLGELGPVAWGIGLLVLGMLLVGLMGTGRAGHHPSPDSPPPSMGPLVSWIRHIVEHRYESPNQRQAGIAAELDLEATVGSESGGLAQTLERFARHVEQHGIDQEASAFLIRVARTHRAIDRHARQLLTLLARSGWRRDPDKRQLAHEVESILRQVFTNNGLFSDALRIAEAAVHGGNVQLLTESITHMRLLEQQSLQLIGRLTEITERMQQQASSVRADG